MTNKLKPCPFCGSAVSWCEDDDHKCHRIKCGSCKYSLDIDLPETDQCLDDYRKTASTVWNSRTPHIDQLQVKQNELKTCPVCGADALYEISDHTYQFRHGEKFCTVDGLLDSLCGKCGASMFTPDQMKFNNTRVREFQANLPDYISPLQISELRERYHLTLRDMDKIFEGGITTFAKYERGVKNPSAGITRQMLAALKDAEFMHNLARVHGVDIPNPTKVENNAQTEYQAPEGWQLVPTGYNNKIVYAIERAIDDQLLASGMNVASMYRQDGAAIYKAALDSAPKFSEQARKE